MWWPSALTSSQMRAKNRSLTIHEVFEADMPRLWADERAVRQICLNLLVERHQVHPAGRRDLAQGRLDGIGRPISQRQGQRPWNSRGGDPDRAASFGQGSNSIKSAEQGAGLGLPIAKSLVDLHNGTFTLKSKLRIGTEVIVTFPPERVMSALAPLAEPAPSIEPAQGYRRQPPP